MARLLRVLATLLGAVCLLALPARSAPPVEIVRFNALVEIGAEDRIMVTEELLVRVSAAGANHGIYRDIPVNPRWRDRARQKTALRVLDARIDGQARPADDVEDRWPFMRIYLRDRDRFLSAGAHQFVLKYEMTQQIGFFDTQDELTWNVTGSGWNGIGSAACLVLPPPGAAFADYQAWLGRLGERAAPVRVTSVERGGRKALLFQANRPIRPGEDFTVAVAWPKGVVKAPEPVRPEAAIGFTLGLAALLLLSLVTAGLIWFRFGKDPEPGPAIPLFYPPKTPARLCRRGRAGERLSAAAVDFVWNRGVLGARGLAGLFIALVERGDCKLLGDAQSGFAIEGIQSTSPVPEEASAARLIGSGLRLNRDDGARLAYLKDAIAAQLRLDYAGQWKKNLLWVLITFLPALIGLGLLLRWYLGPFGQWPFELEDVALTGMGGPALVGGLLSFASGRTGFRRALPVLAGVALAVVLAAMLYTQLFDEATGLLWLFSPLQIGLMGAIPLAPALFAPFMDAPSLEAARLRQAVAGLAMYIGAAEADRLNAANPPDKPLELYHRLLPYAVALGLERAWGERFAKELAALDETTVQANAFLTSPGTMTSLVRGTNATLVSHAAALRAASRSSGSSFGGFGGGAGGGGGGGGGGGC